MILRQGTKKPEPPHFQSIPANKKYEKKLKFAYTIAYIITKTLTFVMNKCYKYIRFCPYRMIISKLFVPLQRKSLKVRGKFYGNSNQSYPYA